MVVLFGVAGMLAMGGDVGEERARKEKRRNGRSWVWNMLHLLRCSACEQCVRAVAHGGGGACCYCCVLVLCSCVPVLESAVSRKIGKMVYVS